MSTALYSWTREHVKPPAHVRLMRGTGGKASLMVRCSVCGREVRESLVAFEALSGALFRHGWSYPTDPRRATCPGCCQRIKADKAAGRGKSDLSPKQKQAAFCRIAGIPKRGEAVMAETKPAAAADAPRASTLADRQKIAESLDAHYDIEAGCYTGTWSDDEVARVLAMPRAWVAQVRDLTFGPDVTAADKRLPGEIAALDARFKAMAAEVVDHANKGMALMDKVDAALKDLAALSARAGAKKAA